MEGGLKVILPHIPSLAATALSHSLGRTPTSSKWDLRTAITVQVLRRLISDENKPHPVGKVQAATVKDAPVKGKTWVAKAKITAPSPEGEGLRERVWTAIDELKPKDSGELQYTKPDLADIEVEWTGFRDGVGKDEPLPQVSEEEKYKRLMNEPSRTSDTTILYFHGGAYYLADPVVYRDFVSRLAKSSQGRVCSVRYRLAPQTAFPGQLLDALLVYLSLLYPPAGSIHDAVPAKNIVFAGDSAGGNLSFALLQLLLHFHRTNANPTVRFHDREVPIPLPAGVASASPWVDVTRSLPSITGNSSFDYLPPPSDTALFRFPHDDIWPSKPPRGDMFCDLSLIDHPLTSPMVASDWKGAPPLLLSSGKEALEDEIRFLAGYAAGQGVPVQFELYDSMPHVFAMLLPFLQASKRSVQSWGDFCRQCVENPESIKTNGTLIPTKDGKEESIDMGTLNDQSLEEVQKLLSETKLRKMQTFEQQRAKLAGVSKASL